MLQRPLASALGLAFLIGAAGPVAAEAIDCHSPAQALACSTNDDCACGIGPAGACAVQARECVGAGDCYDFCHGFLTELQAVCRSGRCTRARASRCTGDCDADAAVGIAELMVGVGVALDRHPLAACANLDLDLDGAAGVAELVRAVRADGCAAAAPRAAGLRGYYDAELTTQGAVSGASAEVYDTDDGLLFSIDQRPNWNIFLSGPLVGDRLTLTGGFLVTDVIVGLSGEATVATRDGEEVISGTIQSSVDLPPDPPDAFVLRRPAAADAAHFSGSYTLRFSGSPRGNGQPSSAMVRLEVARDGFAFSGEGEDRGSDGALYGTLTTGTCEIAPRGHLSCSMGYLFADSQLSNPLRLTGLLAADGGGSGSFLAGADPPFFPAPYVVGIWTVD